MDRQLPGWREHGNIPTVTHLIIVLSLILVDVAIFNHFKEGSWWRAPLISTIIGSALDTALFFTIAS